MTKITSLLSGFLLAAISFAPLAAQAQAPHYTHKQITDMVWTAVKTELKAAKNDHSVFIYHDHDVQPGKNKYTIVVQTTSHGAINRVTRVNGKAIPLSKQRAKVENFANSPSLQQKQRQNNEHDAKQTEQLLKMIPSAFIWKVKSQTPTEITLAYSPNPNFNPPNMQDRVFAAMAGTMVLNRQQHRIVLFSGKLIHSVNFFWGLLGKIYKGGTFSVRREQLEPHVWEIVEMHTHINGHILFFKTISANEDDVDTDWRKAPPNLTLKQAAKLAMQQPNWPNVPGTQHNGSSPAAGKSSKSH